jgi:hypothetical protein
MKSPSPTRSTLCPNTDRAQPTPRAALCHAARHRRARARRPYTSCALPSRAEPRPQTERSPRDPCTTRAATPCNAPRSPSPAPNPEDEQPHQPPSATPYLPHRRFRDRCSSAFMEFTVAVTPPSIDADAIISHEASSADPSFISRPL